MKKELIEEPIQIGQTLYECVKDRNKPAYIKPYVVNRVGRKYFYINGTDVGFSKDSLLYENKQYSQCNVQLYKTEQEILDREEKAKLFKELQRYFSYSSKECSLSQLRAIMSIINA